MRNRELKDSAIPWIGEIPEGWNVKKLKFSCKLFGRIGFRGYTADDLVEESEGAITLSPTNMNNFNLDYSKCSYLSWDKYYESPEIMVGVGDVLLVKTASVGKCSYVDYLPKETTVNPQILVLKEHKDCSKFVAYLFHTSIGEAYINTTKGGSTIYTISQEKIGNYEFAFPPFTEQQRIAEFLDRKCAEVDEMIALQEQIIEELKAYKQSVITEAVTKGLNPNVPMKDSGIEWIGQIPEHWKHDRLKNLFMLHRGYDLAHEEFVNNGVPVYGSGGFMGYHNEVKVFAPNIIIGRSGSTGKLHYIQNDFWAHNTGIYISDNKGNNMKYIYYLLTTIDMDFLSTKTAVPTLDRKKIQEHYFVYTRVFEEQQAIANYLDEKCADIDSLIQTKQSKIDSLKEYKKSIIYEYVTGKKEVIE